MLKDWLNKIFFWWMSLTDWWINQRREARMHEEFMHANVASFKAALPPIAGDHDLDRQLSLYTKYEEYLTKARQANHPVLTIYGPSAIAFAGLLIALAIAGAGYRASHTQALRDNQELVINVLQASTKETAEHNLMALRRAGLLHLNRNRIRELAQSWENGNRQ